MPESTCLHIQDRESGPIRVVEIPWISVRIGRAAYCEVRLTEHDLAEEACRLYRRGRSWHLVPVDDPEPDLARRPAGGRLVSAAVRRAVPRRPLLLDAPPGPSRRARLGDVPGARAGQLDHRSACTRGPPYADHGAAASGRRRRRRSRRLTQRSSPSRNTPVTAGTRTRAESGVLADGQRPRSAGRRAGEPPAPSSRPARERRRPRRRIQETSLPGGVRFGAAQGAASSRVQPVVPAVDRPGVAAGTAHGVDRPGPSPTWTAPVAEPPEPRSLVQTIMDGVGTPAKKRSTLPGGASPRASSDDRLAPGADRLAPSSETRPVPGRAVPTSISCSSIRPATTPPRTPRSKSLATTPA